MQGLSASTIASSARSVTISAGTLQGGLCNATSNLAYFKSIPYAQSPTGDMRFAPPEPLAKSIPTACVQFGAEFAEAGPTSEDW